MRSYSALLLLGACACVAKPNVLFLLTDDQGFGDVSYTAAQGAQPGAGGLPWQPNPPRTPNLDAMAKAGIRFTSGYVTCPVCSPTRAGLLTGKYQQRFGHENNIGQSWEIEHPELMGLPV